MHRILLVEDEPHNLALLRTNLRQMLPHCQFDSATCFRHARQLVEYAYQCSQPYFAVVLDLFLPEEPGGEVFFDGDRGEATEEPRPIMGSLQQYAPHTWVVFHTSFANEPRVREAIDRFYRTVESLPGEFKLRGNDLLVEKKEPRSDLIIAGHIFTERLAWWCKVQTHSKNGSALPESAICRDPLHMQAEIAAELHAIWRHLDERARRRVCVTLKIDESRASDSNAPAMGTSEPGAIRERAEKQLDKLRSTRHFQIRHATNGPNHVDEALLDSYADALDSAYDRLQTQRGVAPLSKDGSPTDVFIFYLHDPFFAEPRAHACGTADGDSCIVLPSLPFHHSAAALAAHECAHLFNLSIGPGSISTSPGWAWFDEATALAFELQFIHGEHNVAKVREDHRAGAWLTHPEVSVFDTSAAFCGFPGAVFLWFLIKPTPHGCGLGEEFLNRVWGLGKAAWDEAKINPNTLAITLTVFSAIDTTLAGRTDPCCELFGYEFARRLLFLAELCPELAASPLPSHLSPANRALEIGKTAEMSMPVPWGCLFCRLTPPEAAHSSLTVHLQFVHNGDGSTDGLADVRAQLLFCLGEMPTERLARLRPAESPPSPSPLTAHLPLPTPLPADWSVYLLIANTQPDPPHAQQNSLARRKLSVVCEWL